MEYDHPDMSQSLELWSMKCFIVLAEELHFGRGAKRLNMTQPTLSQQIRKLEAHFGVQLFIRSTRSVELTPSGEVFLPLAREALTKLDEAVLLSKLAAGDMYPGGEQLKIGAINPAVHRLLPLILRRFRKRFPKTRLDVRIFDSSEILRALERGEYDVGIMRPPSNGNVIRYRPLVSDRFVAVIPKHSPLASRSTLMLSDFVGHDVFTLDRFDLSSFKSLHDQIIETGIVPDPGIRVSNTTAALALAAAGLGITFLPEWIEGIVGSDVVLRPVEDLGQEISIGIAWRADNPMPGILPFVEYAELVARPS
ncbi:MULTISPECIES: LysR family transcriptional regulator [unclassified Chelatococcus]|uniref:LysR substrate-binding domain-containing protein n=1 Tax=unclassified Chelatococcus TaxID=2638111 RepID=UPI0020C033C2|nr:MULTISPECIES: LysR family transcriptional regulator [unclassified Chelatococcus]MCO5078917.1 LysR family transcriptional regulator [Chelatococcus sp.]CAH1650888.1 Transcriptional regulator [Hyphomicrobiales bacterium]CAH1686432.1 Transcriptional regulator [Hyphomicrobiales bacterium]